MARMTLEFDLEDDADHQRALAVVGLIESMRNGHGPLPGDEWAPPAIGPSTNGQHEPPFDPADEWPAETAAPAPAEPDVGDTQSEADEDDAAAEAPELRDEALSHPVTPVPDAGYSEQSVDEKELKAKTKAELVRIAIFNEIFTEERIRTEKPSKQTLIDSIVAYSTLDEDGDAFDADDEADGWTTADNRHGGAFASPAPVAPVAADDGWPAPEVPTPASGDWGAAQAPPEADDWNS